LTDIQKYLEKSVEKINNTPVNDLSSAVSKIKNFFIEERIKRQGLH
jgi:hypothetical protein